MDKDEKLVDFGFDVEIIYVELLENGEYEDYFYFCWFKMMFYDKDGKLVSLVRKCNVFEYNMIMNWILLVCNVNVIIIYWILNYLRFLIFNYYYILFIF